VGELADLLGERPRPPRRAVDRARDWVVWFGPARLAAGVLSVAAVALALLWLLRAPAPPAEASLPMASPVETSAPVTTTTAPALLVVHVAGAIESPGVWSVPAGARVVDAIRAAGGLAADGVTDALNLAAPLHDGDRVYVPRAGESLTPAVGVTPASETTVAAPVDVNTATAAQLEALPGIGPALAAAIVTYRTDHGPFAGVESLADVAGLGPA
jgi:competence protein ComEA